MRTPRMPDAVATPRLVTVKPITVIGITARTSNAIEAASPDNASPIGTLWARFHSEGIGRDVQHRIPDIGPYGVVYDYESDVNGEYTMLVGVAVTREDDQPPFTRVAIEAGRYLTFDGIGQLPGNVIAAWRDAWAYFENAPQYERRYGTDFEQYLAKDHVRVHVGIR